MIDRFSHEACPLCGWRHKLDDFLPRDAVRTLVVPNISGAAIRPGSLGRVVEWSQYGGPLYVRVQFPWLDEYDCNVRENFYPCELEHEVPSQWGGPPRR